MRQQAECLGVTLSVGLATNVCQKAFMVNVNNLAAVLSRKPASTNHAVKMTRVKWCYGFLILFTWKWLFFCVCRIFHATANGVHYGSYVFKRGENALILHIKALHTLKLELSYNLDDFHLFISRPSCYMCEVARFMFNTSESDLFISRHASTILYTEAPTITHCNFS